MKYLRAMIVSAFACAAQAAPALAEREAPSTNKYGLMECGGRGNNTASNGEMSTYFGNQYWSHMGCGDFRRATEILKAAPKVPEGSALPTNKQYKKGESLAVCYFKSFAYAAPEYHARQKTSDGRTSVGHGWYGFDTKTFNQVERAVLHACNINYSS